jgi:hypothetical protein
MGKAELIEPFSDTYNEHAQIKKIPIEALKKYHKEVQLYMLEGADHGGSEFFSDKVLDIMEAFLQRIVSAS